MVLVEKITAFVQACLKTMSGAKTGERDITKVAVNGSGWFLPLPAQKRMRTAVSKRCALRISIPRSKTYGTSEPMPEAALQPKRVR